MTTNGGSAQIVSAAPNTRLAALGSLALLVAAVVVAIIAALDDFPGALAVLGCLVLAVVAASWGLVRPGAARALALAVAALAVVGAVVLVIAQGSLLENVIVVAAVVLSLGAARLAFAARAQLPHARKPSRAVLFFNPKSGGGKSERFHVAREAEARGVDAIELQLGDDLEQLVRAEVARGADALGMAGGDGSQAIVAAVAAEHGLPYVCVPAGTRNHFALDLGVDRDDVVGALDAFVDGRERVVDLAAVNNRIFVNNVSLGVYAEAVQKSEYRDAKLRTIVDTLPALYGPGGQRLNLEWKDGDGTPHDSADVILVSNDPYRLGRALASGTRPSLERGVLGIAAFGGRRPNGDHGGRVLEWSAPEFEVGSRNPIAAGVDGEALMLEPPLRFVTHPHSLRVLIAPQHPGASPSARLPAGAGAGVRDLARMALHGAL